MNRGHALLFEESLRVPQDAFTYDGFQEWLVSGDFPEEGRIDFLAGDLEVDMLPEELHTHGGADQETRFEIRALREGEYAVVEHTAAT